MHERPQDSEKKYHAELSERLLTVDMWADIVRKTLIVAIVSFTVWAGCALMRFLVGIGTQWLFETAEAYHARHALIGGAVILVIMVMAGIARGLLLLSPTWKDAEGDGIDNALVSFHQTYQGDGNDPSARYAEPTFLRAARKLVLTTLTIGGGGSGGLGGTAVVGAVAVAVNSV